MSLTAFKTAVVVMQAFSTSDPQHCIYSFPTARNLIHLATTATGRRRSSILYSYKLRSFHFICTMSSLLHTLKLFTSCRDCDHLVENWCLTDQFGDDERQEAQHCQSVVPSVSTGDERPKTASIGGLAVYDGDERCIGEKLHCTHEDHQSTGGGIEQLLEHGQSCRLLRDECPHHAQHGEAAVDGLRGSPIESEEAQEQLVACLGSPLDLRPRSESHNLVEPCGGLGSEVGALL